MLGYRQYGREVRQMENIEVVLELSVNITRNSACFELYNPETGDFTKESYNRNGDFRAAFSAWLGAEVVDWITAKQDELEEMEAEHE